MKFGIYRLHEVLDDYGIRAIETEYGIPINVISLYRAWNSCDIKMDLPWLERVKSSSRDLLLTWEPWQHPNRFVGRPENQPEFSLSRIVAGHYDDYIRSFSKALYDFPHMVYLRIMHEMNGNWYPWCGKVNGNTVDLFVPAWHHIRDIVCENVRPNIQWVWTPYAASYPAEPDNDIESYFPGDNALDWVGIDGYNWGTYKNQESWLSFEQIFGNAYKILIRISRRPIMIAEFASSEKGGDKAKWIIDAFTSIKQSFDRINLLIWFDENKECDWRIASSSQALSTFRQIGKDIFSA